MRRGALVLVVALAIGCAGTSGGATGAEDKPLNGPEDVAVPNSPARTAASLARVERALRAPKTRPTEVERLGWSNRTRTARSARIPTGSKTSSPASPVT